MRTTVRLSNSLLEQAKRLAAEQHTTLTALIAQGLQCVLSLRKKQAASRQRVKLKTSDGGGLCKGVDLDNNELLRDIMDGLA